MFCKAVGMAPGAVHSKLIFGLAINLDNRTQVLVAKFSRLCYGWTKVLGIRDMVIGLND